MYAARFSMRDAERQHIWAVLTRHFFQRWIRDTDSVLDLGSGYCEFINTVKAAKKFALDLNPETPRRVGEGICVLSQDVCEDWRIPAASLDVVFTSNFFEHLPDKASLEKCARHAFRALKPGGTLIALGPNIRFCGDVYWDFFDHLIPLSDRSTAELLRLAGFHVQHVIPRFLPYTMSQRRLPSPAFVRIYLALPMAWRIFGKQFLIIASKP